VDAGNWRIPAVDPGHTMGRLAVRRTCWVRFIPLHSSLADSELCRDVGRSGGRPVHQVDRRVPGAAPSLCMHAFSAPHGASWQVFGTRSALGSHRSGVPRLSCDPVCFGIPRHGDMVKKEPWNNLPYPAWGMKFDSCPSVRTPQDADNPDTDKPAAVFVCRSAHH
jgi:hypothetical protein